MRRLAVNPLVAVLVPALALSLAACAGAPRWPADAHATAIPAQATVRPVALGQQWVYQVRNLYNGEIEDEVTETVVAVTPQIHIQRTSRRRGALDDEIQDTWGSLVQDGHWDLPLRYDQPLPAWPADLASTRCTRYADHYRLLADPDSRRRWELSMTPRHWETITAPAGAFTVLQFDNRIHFVSNDPQDVESERDESVWFAPAVGRWVLRRSHGVHYVPGRGGDMHEAYRQWELLSWR